MIRNFLKSTVNSLVILSILLTSTPSLAMDDGEEEKKSISSRPRKTPPKKGTSASKGSAAETGVADALKETLEEEEEVKENSSYSQSQAEPIETRSTSEGKLKKKGKEKEEGEEKESENDTDTKIHSSKEIDRILTPLGKNLPLIISTVDHEDYDSEKPITILPAEIVEMILGYLDSPLITGQVCRFWRTLSINWRVLNIEESVRLLRQWQPGDESELLLKAFTFNPHHLLLALQELAPIMPLCRAWNGMDLIGLNF